MTAEPGRKFTGVADAMQEGFEAILNSLADPVMVVGPDGGVLAETTDPVVVVPLQGALVDAARRSYPCYPPYRPEVFSAGWRPLGERP